MMLFQEIKDPIYSRAHILTYNWMIERNYEYVSNSYKNRRYEIVAKKNDEYVLLAIYKRARKAGEMNTSFNFKKDKFETLSADSKQYGYRHLFVSHFEYIDKSDKSFHVVASENYIVNELKRTKHLNIYFNQDFRMIDNDHFYSNYVRGIPVLV